MKKIDRKNRLVSFKVSGKLKKPVVVDKKQKVKIDTIPASPLCGKNLTIDDFASKYPPGIGILMPEDRTLTIEMYPIDENLPGKVRIFGASIAVDETYNLANNMTVNIPEASHRIVKESTFDRPFRIKGLIYEVSEIGQLDKPLVVVSRNSNGSQMTKAFLPSNFTDPRNFNPSMIKTSAFQGVIDANKAIEIDFIKGASATMILTINDMFDLSHALSNNKPRL